MSQIYGKYFSSHQLSPSHLKLIDLTGSGKKVLELGSSSGYLTEVFKQNDCQITIVELDPQDAKQASKFAKKSYVGDLDNPIFLKSLNGTFDVIVAADILEHLKSPEQVLNKLKNQLTKNGKFLISLPNIACWRIRRDLFVKGSFEYQEWGILDKTHLRFYTYTTIRNMIESCGLKVVDIYPFELDYPFRRSIQKVPLLGKIIEQSFGKWVTNKYPNLCVSHMVIEAVVK